MNGPLLNEYQMFTSNWYQTYPSKEGVLHCPFSARLFCTKRQIAICWYEQAACIKHYVLGEVKFFVGNWYSTRSSWALARKERNGKIIPNYMLLIPILFCMHIDWSSRRDASVGFTLSRMNQNWSQRNREKKWRLYALATEMSGKSTVFYIYTIYNIVLLVGRNTFAFKTI